MNNIDNDILCLEKLVTAILFSDKLIGIDDYKDDFRAARLKNFDFIKFSKIDELYLCSARNGRSLICAEHGLFIRGLKTGW